MLWYNVLFKVKNLQEQRINCIANSWWTKHNNLYFSCEVWRQWCRSWGCRGVQVPLKSFDCRKSEQNPWKFGQNPRNVQHRCFDTFKWDWIMKYVWILTFFQKMAPNEINWDLFCLEAPSPTTILFFVGDISVDSKHEDLYFSSERKICRGMFGAQKLFGQNSFATLKICLLLHLCLALSATCTKIIRWNTCTKNYTPKNKRKGLILQRYTADACNTLRS